MTQEFIISTRLPVLNCLQGMCVSSPSDFIKDQHRVVMPKGTGCPRRLWMPHPWKHSRPGWMWLWAAWSGGWWPCAQQGGLKPDDYCGPFQPRPFCDSMISTGSTTQLCILLSGFPTYLRDFQTAFNRAGIIQSCWIGLSCWKAAKQLSLTQSQSQHSWKSEQFWEHFLGGRAGKNKQTNMQLKFPLLSAQARLKQTWIAR